MDLALNNLQWFICHKTKRKQTKPVYKDGFSIKQSTKADMQFNKETKPNQR